MRLIESYSIKEFRGTYLLIYSDKGKGSVDLQKGIQVNGSFAFLWKYFSSRDFTEEDIVNALLSEYDLSLDEAKSAASDIIALWRDHGMIQL